MDPCETLTAGVYAHALCTDIGRLRESELEASSSAQHASQRHAPADEPKRGMILVSTAETLQVRPGNVAAPRARSQRRQLTVAFLHPADISNRCRDRGFALHIEGGVATCAEDGFIIIANPCASQSGWYERTLCHELAHVNGWAVDHSGGFPIVRSDVRLASESPEAIAFARASAKFEQRTQ